MNRAILHYENIQRALSNDALQDISAEARALASVKEIGIDARRLASRLATATDLKTARADFAALSDVVVPVFVKAAPTNVQAYYCPMKKAKWVQRTDEYLRNPYYGKAMPRCGERVR